ncbi:Abhydrolase-3 domain-containing protein [Mycena indigotica]|uniref:Abhydrolase-3 domain-containing protein n=1 Tax=Mycena indigotica TaxID=2126181 RepID=A0A8H6TAB3_9AGAR|nr:Abhydrolase-3 domain-containing protein [Mycena indigotica]KAF7315080.1 Abhydrolase-3 domain-containing protein [Mycena indigotica]
MNGLTTQAGFRIGPIVLETLVKHYFERLKLNFKVSSDNPTVKTVFQLRQEELLYDEAFSIVKAFLNAACYHTVEEIQSFSNTRTPSPPWVHVVRTLVPLSCCDEAATILIKALGGEEAARKVVGGCKWWQVRSGRGIDGQWITAKKDWQEAKRRHKQQNEQPQPAPDDEHYEKRMDDLRCILYAHGGGYYFGSVDQERYSIQRHARKINGRAFAINYRLAPQYPFPCALQDLLAAYLYLIRPPPDAAHRPVNPAHIIVAGDSAGGGLTLALLQVLRDSGLPLPAGGVLVSPWCDLSHSFPSIHTNTATDVIPEYGLSFQKPSSLWPPPSEDMSRRVHASLRTWIRKTFASSDSRPITPPPPPTASVISLTVPEAPVHADEPLDMGATAPIPLDSERLTLTTATGEVLTVDQQVHLYTKNSLLPHPLVSGALSYLGGLPPLLIIASDKEVLRDEIIYTAHKAANPDKFPIREETRGLYPPLQGIEQRFGPTKVHLQVYDDTAHVLPVLFAFTTPGKFCFRAIATFCREVTGLPHRQSTGASTPRAEHFDLSGLPPLPPSPLPPGINGLPSDSPPPEKPPTVRRSKSLLTSKRLSVFRSATLPPLPTSVSQSSTSSSELKPPTPQRQGSVSYFSRFAPSRANSTTSNGDVYASPSQISDIDQTAGEPNVYVNKDWKEGLMVRERISTRGVIRPLEPESELAAFTVSPENIGVISELAIRRYIDGTQKWDRKFSGARKTVEKHRHRNLERARKDTVKNMGLLHSFIGREAESEGGNSVRDGLLAMSGSWSWAWALDAYENPPPSSIVSRRDTQEALRLARIADQPMFQTEEHSMSGNNLWSVMVNFLTVMPDKDKREKKHGDSPEKPPIPKRKSTFRNIFPPKEKEELQAA